jgi:uncharacterized membrane protein
MRTWLWTALLSFAPISELRGGIPFAIAGGIPWYAAYLYCVILNALVSPVCWLFLATLHKLFLHIPIYKKFFASLIERARTKLHGPVEKWGAAGIAIFVAIPLPMTGAWTGTLGAWVLGLSRKKTLLAVAAGVAVAGAIVTAVWLGGGALVKAVFTK